MNTNRIGAGGFTLLEVLITMIVLAVGMLGLANLQSKMHITEVESYQRAHAVLLLQDMVDKINTNRANAASYVTGATGSNVLGTPHTDPTDCTSLSNLVTRDQCYWSNSLKGAAEQAGGATVGAMIGARGCVEQVQAVNAAAGVCTPGIYRVTIACGKDQYGADDRQRRVLTAQVTIGLPACS